MSKEREGRMFGEVTRIAALAVLGLISTLYPENTKPGQWAARKKMKLKR